MMIFRRLSADFFPLNGRSCSQNVHGFSGSEILDDVRIGFISVPKSILRSAERE